MKADQHQKASETTTGAASPGSQHKLLTGPDGRQYLISSNNNRGSQILSQEDDRMSDTISPLLKVSNNRHCQSEILTPQHRFDSLASVKNRASSQMDGRHEHLQRFMNYGGSVAGSMNPVGSQILCDGDGNQFVIT